MKKFEKWMGKEYTYLNTHGIEMAAAGWRAALKWVKREAITMGQHGEISRKIINRELGNK